MCDIKIKLVNKNAKIPTQGSQDAAGLDLFSTEEKILKAKERTIVDLGIQIELPKGYFGQISGRSGLAYNNGIIVGGGIIDNDYRGNVFAILFNLSDHDFEIKIGAKIAQLICLPYICPSMNVIEYLSRTERNESGFGSTG
jgi:dUTP pyrophosphatase